MFECHANKTSGIEFPSANRSNSEAYGDEKWVTYEKVVLEWR